MATAMTDFKDIMGIEQPELRKVLERVRPQMLAPAQSELLPVNLDPLAAVTIARGALPKLLELRPLLASAINSFELANLDQLELYALALTQAQTVYQGVVKRSKALATISAQADELRARLLVDTSVHVQRGHISESRLANLKGPNGHRNIASDLLILAALLRDSWPNIRHRTTISEDELKRAELLGDQLVTAIATRKQSTAVAEVAALERQQTYTLFVRAYNQVRRAVSYLRWDEGDAERFAPSLYAKKKAVRRKRAIEPTATAKTEVAEMRKAPIGMPGSDPFLN